MAATTYNGTEISASDYVKITASFMQNVILPFKKGLNESQAYIGKIERFVGNLSHHENMFFEFTPQEVKKFDGYVISVSGNGIFDRYDVKGGGAWFEIFDKEELKRDIENISFKINDKKVASKWNGFYSWAIKNEDLSIILELANKYKLVIL